LFRWNFSVHFIYAYIGTQLYYISNTTIFFFCEFMKLMDTQIMILRNKNEINNGFSNNFI
jgi:hypothetical protein